MTNARNVLVSVSLVGGSLFLASSAQAKNLEVGPNKPFSSMQQAVDAASPGDVILVTAGPTPYTEFTIKRSGTGDKPIVIRGVMTSGQRPRISGGTNTVHIQADHIVMEGFDISGGSARCVFHHGHDVTLRDSVVHDCANHGILGADDDSGSLLLDRVEVFAAGNSSNKHPIYIATDERKHPGSVFRMQHCYLHDAKGGNSVKSRAERNEIYYNWIEGAPYHELELIGPDGQEPELKREDSDVVGNVFRKLNDTYMVRIGGDGTGETKGRYRFANNTFLLAKDARAVFRIFDGIESVEMINNVFHRLGGSPITVVRTAEAKWSTGAERIAGANNWLPRDSDKIPSGWKGTLLGTDPGFVSRDALDLRPVPTSQLVNAAASLAPSSPDFAIADALAQIASQPSVRSIASSLQRPSSGALDIGAYESGSDLGPGSPKAPVESQSPHASNSAKVVPSGGGAAGGRCGCRVPGQDDAGTIPGLSSAALASLALLSARTRRRKR